MRRKEEWDYPPRPRYRYGPIIDDPPQETWANSPGFSLFANGYWTVVKTIVKVVLGSICGLVLVGCVWFAMQILKGL